MTNTEKQFIDLINSEVKPALGCTEPVAVALAVARSAEEVRKLGEEPLKVVVEVSRNILKNGMGVGIPGTGMVGLHVASAAALVCGKSEYGLEVLREIEKCGSADIKAALENQKVEILLAEVDEKLYIKANCISENHSSVTLIQGLHDNITRVEVDREVIFEKEVQMVDIEGDAEGVNQNDSEKLDLNLSAIYDFATTVEFLDIKFILESVVLNLAISEEGLRNKYGLQVGSTVYNNMGGEVFGDGLFSKAVAMTAAAADARMAGSTMVVMSNSGSGNQGITATMPVVAAAQKYESTEEELARALVMSHLVAIHIKQSLGRLSALCGCVVASTGSACGIVMLKGGGLKEMGCAIKNMVGNITGMVCDGAKVGCALKVASGVGAAVQSAVLALNGISATHNDGIIDDDVEKTLKNLSSIGTEGMKFTDSLMLSIMQGKRHV